jgi:hypothetical protein
MLTILVVDHPLIDPTGGHRAVRLRSVQDFLRGVEGATAAALAEVPVLVDRGELLDIPELLAAFVEDMMDGEHVHAVAVTPGGQPPQRRSPCEARGPKQLLDPAALVQHHP